MARPSLGRVLTLLRGSSKINNAAATIGADAKLESEIMRSHVPLVLVITFVVGLTTAVFIWLGI